MGNCNLKSDTEDISSKIQYQSNLSLFYQATSISNYQLVNVIGKGGFGKVWVVQNKKTKVRHAMKIMSKAKIISKKSVTSVMNELQLLCQLKHNFIINMICAFQDRENLYLAMDLLTGGDLRYHICRQKKFSEVQTKFFVSCVVIGLEYLHSNGILHRDIKPENLVFDKSGLLRLTDLGIARVWKPENQQDTSGTPGYMAPEVMCRQNHGVAVDYFALGVIVYECMMGKRPYVGKSRQEIRDLIISKQVQIKKAEIPEGWSLEAVDFTNKLIQRKPANRLGVNGPEEVKSHPWLADVDWDKLQGRLVEPPFIPKDDEQNYLSNDKRDSQADLEVENQLLLRRNSIQSLLFLSLFSGYAYSSTPLTLKNSSISTNQSSRSTSVYQQQFGQKKITV